MIKESNNGKDRILVVGSGQIGSYTFISLMHKGRKVSRAMRRSAIFTNDLYLDLTDPREKWNIPEDTGAAVICAAVTSLKQCEDNPEEARKVNVEATMRLIEHLESLGVFTLFLSTNHVFDGSINNCPADTPYSPVTEYGRLKVEVEKQIIDYFNNTAILRISKVITSDMPLFDKWIENLHYGEAIEAFSDMYCSLVPVSAVSGMIMTILDSREKGLYQMSGSRDVSYEWIAKYFALLADADQSLVNSCQAAGRFTYPLHRHTTLDMSAIAAKFAYEPNDPEAVLKEYFDHYLLKRT